MKKRIVAGVMMVCMLALTGCSENSTSADADTTGNTEEQQTAEVVDSSETELTGNSDTTTMDTQVSTDGNSEEKRVLPSGVSRSVMKTTINYKKRRIS